MSLSLDNGVKSVTLAADMAGVRAMLAAERKRGQASIGIGANLATAYQNYSVASYQWNASWFATFVGRIKTTKSDELPIEALHAELKFHTLDLYLATTDFGSGNDFQVHLTLCNDQIQY